MATVSAANHAIRAGTLRDSRRRRTRTAILCEMGGVDIPIV